MRTKALTQQQFNQLQKCLNWRDSLILQVSVETGCRISDILSFSTSNIIAQQTICEKKTNKQRYIEISTSTLMELKRYVKAEKIATGEQIFKVSRQTVYNNLKRHTKKLGYKNISSHSTRKLYAQRFYKRYGLKATQEELNHSDVNTTILYISGVI